MIDPFAFLGPGADGIKAAIDYYKRNKKKKEFREKFNNDTLKRILDNFAANEGRDIILAIRDAAQAELPVKKQHEGLKAARNAATARTVRRAPTIITQLIAMFKEFNQLDAIKYILGYTLGLLKRSKTENE